ncbi:molybdopterin-guanine dinucleotide biosynthesis protein A [Peptoclostridium litorale DSM 5388]|uniref:Probable molybdenum cofactor guanylyltransferase n=1 Tax=Peptoclostridium litorale DSM 5388 TaxID=1121324 RepID=A0A069RF81_PEPLI|nr:molybdenum cofactor guanylyltransferase [Peptoclostridium litorale]KDR94865.1 putative molybdenum cofactor guanylyltransferase MobA [Peptoclostridium litorale DSM 5388]SIN94416.1 molybdopterin-guanine dinucleotide biosynthesis protein A [Peptoclostridium litorale DSM 5388]
MCQKIKKFGSAIVLAGGKSSRMGFDKQFISINERRLMDSIVSRLSRVFDDIVIVSNTPKIYMGISYNVVTDSIRGKGPLGGIHAGLKAAKYKYCYLMACDMPNINFDYIDYMKNSIKLEVESGVDIKACVTRQNIWVEPFNAFYSKDMISDIEDHLKGSRMSVLSLLEKLDTLYVEEESARRFSPCWDMFFNMNTKHDIDLYMESIGE